MVAVVVAMIAAVSLLGLAVPRTAALMVVTPATATLAHLERHHRVDRRALDEAVAAGLAAHAWIDSGTLWQQLATAHLGRLRLADADQPEKADALVLAEATLQRSLAQRPGNPIAWWQLARVMQILGRPAERVTAALYLSVVTGNMVDTLLFPRLRLALAKWRHLDEATRRAFVPQLVMALRRDPRQFINLVQRSLAVDEVHIALRDDRALVNLYDALLERFPGHPGLAQN